MNWFKRKVAEVHQAISLKERQRIAEGLEYVKDNSVSFTRAGEKMKLAYRCDESKTTEGNVEIITRQYWYYYWDDYFLYWTRCTGHCEHTEQPLVTSDVSES
jgi:hypothetical protein